MDRFLAGEIGVWVWLFPAHAGMDRVMVNRSQSVLACSPHTRGWTE